VGRTADEGKYIIDVDTSYDQLGCSLLQEQPSGEYHPVGYFSKGLTQAEKDYTVTEMEGLGVVWAVSMLRSYIEGTHFLKPCDHQALRWVLTTTTCTNNRLNRWRVRLAELDYDVRYKAGRRHAVADAIFRIRTVWKDENPILEEIPIVGVTTRSGAVLDPRRPENSQALPIPLVELATAQQADIFCQTVQIDLNTTEATRFYGNRDGMLCRQGHQQGEQHVVVPQSLTKDILQRKHSFRWAHTQVPLECIRPSGEGTTGLPWLPTCSIGWRHAPHVPRIGSWRHGVLPPCV